MWNNRNMLRWWRITLFVFGIMLAGFILFASLTYQRVTSPERPDVGEIILQQKKITPERLRSDIEAFFSARNERAATMNDLYRVTSPFGTIDEKVEQ